jgi:hypothetical protein
MKKIVLICLLGVGCLQMKAQENADRFLRKFRATSDSAARISPYLLITPKEKETVETLAAKGLQVVRQVAAESFVILKNAKNTQALPDAVAANANWKLSPLLLNQHDTSQHINSGKKQFHLYTNVPDQLKKDLLALKDPEIKIEYSSSSVLVISTTFEKLVSQLLYIPAVRFVESGDRTPKEEMAIDGLDLSLNKVNLAHAEFPAINGEGMVVSIKEQKPDTADLDLRGKYLPGITAPATVSAHATIIATMIAGSGNSFITGKGVAWRSAYTSSSFANLLPDPVSEYNRLKVSVQNHSYGTGIENYYGADAAAYDSSSLAIPSLLHVFSSGNSGGDTSKAGRYTAVPGFANLTGSFKMSKNSLSVGATDANGMVSPLSSRGPAFDGRLKPELVAFGADGSSGAAAIVSGITLLCQQLYASKNNGKQPDAALIKAVLVNSTDDVGAKGIDFVSGYGNANAYRALQTITEGRYLTGMADRNAGRSFFIDIPANAINFKTTVAWSDAPALPNAFTALLNDLDLEVLRVATNESWKPWVLNSQPDTGSLKQLAVRGRDSLNNLEQVTIDQPVGGRYEVKVSAYRTTTQQQFFLAYQWDTIGHFRWTYPAANDNLFPGVTAKLRWSSTIPVNGTLDYSTDAGRTWVTVDANANTAKGEYSFSVPDSFHVAMLRMTVNGKQFLSDTFTVSDPLEMSVGFNCIDSLLLYWNHVPAKHYVLYQLVSNFMQPAGVYSDSFAIIKAAQRASEYYAVAPMLHAERTGVRSYALNFSTQGVGCYFEHFLADLESNRTLLHFRIGSAYNVQSITLQKYKGGIFQHIHSFQPNAMQFSAYDSLLTRGINSYRVKLTFTDGSSVYSNIESVNYFTASPFVIYPNPLPSDQQLRILSQDPEGAVLKCWSMDGKMLVGKKLTNTSEAIDLMRSKGIYLIEVIKEGKRVMVEKLVVH